MMSLLGDITKLGIENNLYTYGPLLKDTSIEDAIKVIQNGKEIFLTRYYG